MVLFISNANGLAKASAPSLRRCAGISGKLVDFLHFIASSCLKTKTWEIDVNLNIGRSGRIEDRRRVGD